MSESLEAVSAVRIYPIKSGHEATINGELPSRLTIGETGFKYDWVSDRQWVVIDEAGLFISQRGWNERHKLAFVKDKIMSLVRVDIQSDHVAVVAPNSSHFEIPKTINEDCASQQFDIFGKTFYGIDEGDEGARFFTREVTGLERPVRLYRTDVQHPRLVLAHHHHLDAVNKMAGADGLPYLWTRQASLDQLHDIAGLPRGLKKLKDYRANIESEGTLPPFCEDYALVVSLGGLEAYVTACDRCPVPNIDQDKAENDRLSTRLLAKTRRGFLADSVQLEGGNPTLNPYFGERLNHRKRSVGSTVGVNDPVTIIEMSDKPNVVLRKRGHIT